MNQHYTPKNWITRNWKWLIPISSILSCILLFFSLTGNATFRFGSIIVQPDLVNSAWEIAREDDEVVQKFGTLSPVSFLQKLEGEVCYSDDNSAVHLSVGILGEKRKGKLDIKAHREDGKWVYDTIAARIKKPKKEIINVFPKK